MLYAGILAILLVLLQINVIRNRGAASVSLGTGDSKTLERATRAHGNAIENVPLTLILMALIEVAGAPDVALHTFGIATIVARIIYAFGVTRDPDTNAMRVAGVLINMIVILGCAVYGIYYYVA